MPDITMCKGEECRMKENCYRYKAAKSVRQSYFLSSPIRLGVCEYFIRHDTHKPGDKRPHG